MPKQLLLLCGGIFLCCQPIRSQSSPLAEEKPYIELNGRAEQEVIPNEIFINITIRERYVNKEKQSIEMQEEKLKSALNEIHVDLNNLSLSDANADYVKVKFRTKDVLTKKDYNLKVTNAATLGQVFQQLDKIDIMDAYVARVSHTKLDSIRKEVRIRAIKAAKNKADYLLAAIGEQTGKPLLITEVETPLNTNTYQANSLSYSNIRILDDDSGKDKPQEIQFRKIKVECTMYAKFAIK